MSIEQILNIESRNIINLKKLIENYNEKNKNQFKISLFSKAFDEITGNGFKFKQIYLIFGKSNTGKTQLCHQLCVQAFNNNLGERNNIKVYYLDTENTFRPERIKELALYFQLDYHVILKNIIVSEIMSNYVLLISLKKLEERLSKDNNYILIIDTINKYYRIDLGNRNLSFSKVKDNFIKILTKIFDLTKKYNICTILTAQVSLNPIEDPVIKEIPVGNIFLNHFFTEYLYLGQEKNGLNFVHLFNSLEFPERRFYYRISEIGIEDFKY
ncbi:MAG: ATPase domain-containing protein [Promethearchaeia archaeon]